MEPESASSVTPPCSASMPPRYFTALRAARLPFHDSKLKDLLYQLKNFGITGYEQVEYVGANGKMNEFQAAMGLCNLRHVDADIAKRKVLTERYRERLGGVKGIRLCKEKEGVRYNYAYMPVVFEGYGADRDEIFAALKEYNIYARKYFYPCINDYACYREQFSSDDTPVAKRIASEVLTLPLYPDLSLETVDEICDIILKCGEKDKMNKVLIVIPAYNEEESIFETVTSILNYRKKVDFDLDYVVINDGSTDKTKQILEDNHFNAVNLVMNLGIGGAVQTGYKYALEHDYDVAVQFDGDGQHDIESLSDLLEPIRKSEADLVIGSRFVGDVSRNFKRLL